MPSREFIEMWTQYVTPHVNYEVNPDVSDFIDGMIAFFLRELCDCTELAYGVEFHEYIPDVCEHIMQVIQLGPFQLDRLAVQFIHEVENFPENLRAINVYFQMLDVAEELLQHYGRSSRDIIHVFFMLASIIVYFYLVFYCSNNIGAIIMLVVAAEVIMVQLFKIKTVQDLERLHNHARRRLFRP